MEHYIREGIKISSFFDSRGCKNKLLQFFYTAKEGLKMCPQLKARELLEQYLYDKGIKARYISKKLNIDETIISHFRHGRKDLQEHELVRLIKYLTQNY